uniref:Uncharacterized protein n=1 Tax=Nicotiana tabacum TaxID=4097 RepID=Q8M8B8_TOBAC|nr:hypothetical protein [Nicotiana tabacum]
MNWNLEDLLCVPSYNHSLNSSIKLGSTTIPITCVNGCLIGKIGGPKELLQPESKSCVYGDFACFSGIFTLPFFQGLNALQIVFQPEQFEKGSQATQNHQE